MEEIATRAQLNGTQQVSVVLSIGEIKHLNVNQSINRKHAKKLCPEIVEVNSILGPEKQEK